MPRVDGIDVSHHNVVLDEAAVLPYRLMSCKATEGKKFVSPSLDYYVQLFARKNTQYQGVYHWIRSDSTMGEQVEHLKYQLIRIGWLVGGKLKNGKMIQLDWETTPGINHCEVWMIEEWIDRMRTIVGDRIIVYASDWVPGFTEWREKHPDMPLWYANYNTNPAHPRGGRQECKKFDADVWQWSSTADPPGFDPDIDVNEVLNWATLDRICNYATVTPISPVQGDEVYRSYKYPNSNVAVLAVGAGTVRRAGGSEITGMPVTSISREGVVDLLTNGASSVGSNPFRDYAGYEDADLASLWEKARPAPTQVHFPTSITMQGSVAWK